MIFFCTEFGINSTFDEIIDGCIETFVGTHVHE